MQSELLEVVQAAEMQSRVVAVFIEARWRDWGRARGLLTLEQINQNNHPDWMWGDYEI